MRDNTMNPGDQITMNGVLYQVIEHRKDVGKFSIDNLYSNVPSNTAHILFTCDENWEEFRDVVYAERVQ